jgi:hypothetical protein
LAWNIGTMASTTSAGPIEKLPGIALAIECSTSARCE